MYEKIKINIKSLCISIQNTLPGQKEKTSAARFN